MTRQLAHLHCQSEHTILKGRGHVKTWYKKAQDLGVPAIAFTERGNMGSAMEAYLCDRDEKKPPVKTILGLEALMVQDIEAPAVTGEPVVLLAQNMTGYKNLLKLSKYSYFTGWNDREQKPHIDYDVLDQHKEGLYCLTGSLDGPVAVSFTLGYKIALKAFNVLRDIFGDKLAAEIQLNEYTEQKLYNDVLLKIATEAKTPVVLTNHSLFVSASDYDLAIAAFKIDQMRGRPHHSPKTRISRHAWLKTYEELEAYRKAEHAYITRRAFDNIVDATNAIADDCNVELEVGKHSLPQYNINRHPLYTSDMAEAVDLFRAIAEEGFQRRVVESEERDTEKYRKVFDYEFEVIVKAKFDNYFLIVEDVIRWAKSQDIEVGAARGSVAGSLVAYCCSITDVDPLEFDLLFERFLNPTRISGERAESADALPDIDLDFEQVRRPEVKQYLVDTYGEGSVLTIGTFTTLKVRSLLRDLHRVFDDYHLPIDDQGNYKEWNKSDRVKLLKELDGLDIDDLKAAEKQSEGFQSFIKKFPYFHEYYLKGLDGQIRDVSKHAAGVLITPTDASDWLPVKTEKMKGDTTTGDIRVPVTQWRDKWCERAGLLKFDILGLKTLNVIKMARELIQARHGVTIDIRQLNSKTREDPKVLAGFGEGQTDGDFQFNSRLQSRFLRRFPVTAFEDLIVVNALLRPGPMDADAHNDFVKYKNGEMEPEYDHELVEPLTSNTYGLYIFQEQIMTAAHVLGKMSMSEADIMRTAMKKHDEKQMEVFRPKFVQGSVENGMKEEKAQKLWDKFQAFYAYGFNRCLTGDTQVTLANGRKATIRSLYHRFKRGEKLSVRSFDSNTMSFVKNDITEVIKSGKRHVIWLYLQNGQKLRLTTNHAIMTLNRGFRLAGQLRVDDRILCLPPGCRKTRGMPIDYERTFYDDVKFEDTYDITLAGEPRNFLANGMVVHNSHSASYALLGYFCQYIKTYYPIEFWTATLEFAWDDAKKPENIWSFREIIRRNGFKFAKCSMTRKKPGFFITKTNKIAWPLRAIKGVGVTAGVEIARVFAEHDVKDFEVFLDNVTKRLVNKTVMKNVIMAGAAYKFGHQRDVAQKYFSFRKEEVPEEFTYPEDDVGYWEDKKFERLGYLEHSYRDRYVVWFHEKIVPLGELQNIDDGQGVIVGGKVVRVSKIKTKNGKNLCFVDVLDSDGICVVKILHKYLSQGCKVPEVGDIIEVYGKLEKQPNDKPAIVLFNKDQADLQIYTEE